MSASPLGCDLGMMGCASGRLRMSNGSLMLHSQLVESDSHRLSHADKISSARARVSFAHVLHRAAAPPGPSLCCLSSFAPEACGYFRCHSVARVDS
jgi:hypothetical protein